MADGDGGWGLLGGLGRFYYAEAIRKLRLAGLGWQGWPGLAGLRWVRFLMKKGWSIKKRKDFVHKNKCIYTNYVILAVFSRTPNSLI